MRISDWSSDVCSSDLNSASADDHKRTGPRDGPVSNTPFFSRALLASAVGGLSGDQLRELFGRHRSRNAESLAHVAASVGQPALGGLVFAAFGENGRASCRERVVRYVYIPVGSV